MDIQESMESVLNEMIISSIPVGGGCIANSMKIITGSGREFFLKTGSRSGMYQSEANVLNELAKANGKISCNINSGRTLILRIDEHTGTDVLQKETYTKFRSKYRLFSSELCHLMQFSFVNKFLLSSFLSFLHAYETKKMNIGDKYINVSSI